MRRAAKTDATVLHLCYTKPTCQGINGRFYLPAKSRCSVDARIPWQGLGKYRAAAFWLICTTTAFTAASHSRQAMPKLNTAAWRAWESTTRPGWPEQPTRTIQTLVSGPVSNAAKLTATTARKENIVPRLAVTPPMLSACSSSTATEIKTISAQCVCRLSLWAKNIARLAVLEFLAAIKFALFAGTRLVCRIADCFAISAAPLASIIDRCAQFVSDAALWFQSTAGNIVMTAGTML